MNWCDVTTPRSSAAARSRPHAQEPFGNSGSSTPRHATRYRGENVTRPAQAVDAVTAKTLAADPDYSLADVIPNDNDSVRPVHLD
jgi:hypothetical protein